MTTYNDQGDGAQLRSIDACPRCRYSLMRLPAVHACPECGLRYDDRSRVWGTARMSALRRGVRPAWLLKDACVLIGWLALTYMYGVAYAFGLLIFALMFAYLMYRLYTVFQEGSVVAATRDGLFLRNAEWYSMGQKVPLSSQLILWADVNSVEPGEKRGQTRLVIKGKPCLLGDVFTATNEADEFVTIVRRHIAPVRPQYHETRPEKA
ncbi:MAG: hypothetical protein JSU86_15195 [Phycisphaerales bacterium]|nr:MAG: hypothetical protein JSU86_15195 [Phycisphaerales bacterium]